MCWSFSWWPETTGWASPYFVLFLSFGRLRGFLMVSNYVITITYCRHYIKYFLPTSKVEKCEPYIYTWLCSPLPYESQIWLNSAWVGGDFPPDLPPLITHTHSLPLSWYMLKYWVQLNILQYLSWVGVDVGMQPITNTACHSARAGACQ